MLKDIILATTEGNYPRFENFVKNSWGDFFASMNTSVNSVFSWIKSESSSGFDLIVSVFDEGKLTEVERKKVEVLKRLAGKKKIPFIHFKDDVELDVLKKGIIDALQMQ